MQDPPSHRILSLLVQLAQLGRGALLNRLPERPELQKTKRRHWKPKEKLEIIGNEGRLKLLSLHLALDLKSWVPQLLRRRHRILCVWKLEMLPRIPKQFEPQSAAWNKPCAGEGSKKRIKKLYLPKHQNKN